MKIKALLAMLVLGATGTNCLAAPVGSGSTKPPAIENELVGKPDDNRPVRIITAQQVGKMLCIGGVVPDSGAKVVVNAQLAEVAGQQMRIFVTSVKNSDTGEGVGSVALNGTIFRPGEILWVIRDGWSVCN